MLPPGRRGVWSQVVTTELDPTHGVMLHVGPSPPMLLPRAPRGVWWECGGLTAWPWRREAGPEAWSRARGPGGRRLGLDGWWAHVG